MNPNFIFINKNKTIYKATVTYLYKFILMKLSNSLKKNKTKQFIITLILILFLSFQLTIWWKNV